ncbi:putative secreted protein (Por secretion system target) [Chryseobacterium sp. 52]|uniref:T9SS type A sorting domain-containing protein n=1 Tax=Chryseobacterium sp. 52 TaxID=2035213 RepID=UPI000C1925C3|nr:T9SS type A sorting domain-containing protein [Chryseobacterium sp. 52]PIF45901.1 putative secreted protein (Por secretion system target) [Chryseobacterium sp. 52]
MKKNSFLLLCSFISFFGQAQLALAKDDGTPITNGQVFTYNTTDENAATFHYKIKNTSNNPIQVRIKIVGIQNATGSGFQFCYLSTCLPSVAPNAVYPSNSNAAISIGANSETSSSGYNMWNSSSGTGTFPIDYVVKYYLVDNFNNEYGAPSTITYRYDPNFILSVNDIKNQKNIFAEIPTTLVKNEIEIISKENISYSLHTMEGRTLFDGNLQKGKNSVDTSALNTGMYLLTLRNLQGQVISKKIIKNN